MKGVGSLHNWKNKQTSTISFPQREDFGLFSLISTGKPTGSLYLLLLPGFDCRWARGCEMWKKELVFVGFQARGECLASEQDFIGLALRHWLKSVCCRSVPEHCCESTQHNYYILYPHTALHSEFVTYVEQPTTQYNIGPPIQKQYSANFPILDFDPASNIVQCSRTIHG